VRRGNKRGKLFNSMMKGKEKGGDYGKRMKSLKEVKWKKQTNIIINIYRT
jgi:hypothetical protein